MYDSKIGRWMAPDPYGQYWSPYVGMGNNPIVGVDPDGGFCPTCPSIASLNFMFETAFNAGAFNNGKLPLQEVVVEDYRIAFSSFFSFSFDETISSMSLVVAAFAPSFKEAASQAKHLSKPSFHLAKVLRPTVSLNNSAHNFGQVSNAFAKNGAAIMKFAAPALLVTSVIANGYSIIEDRKLTWGDAFVAVNTGLQIAFPVYGVVYGVIDLGVAVTSGTSLTGRVKNGIDSNVSGSYDF